MHPEQLLHAGLHIKGNICSPLLLFSSVQLPVALTPTQTLLTKPLNWTFYVGLVENISSYRMIAVLQVILGVSDGKKGANIPQRPPDTFSVNRGRRKSRWHFQRDIWYLREHATAGVSRALWRIVFMSRWFPQWRHLCGIPCCNFFETLNCASLITDHRSWIRLSFFLSQLTLTPNDIRKKKLQTRGSLIMKNKTFVFSRTNPNERQTTHS